MYITYDTTVSVVNTAIVDNVASVAVNSEDAASGGGIYVYYSTMTLTCVTIAGNMADSGAGLYAYGLSSSKPTNIALRNIIAAQNADSFGSAADIAVKNAAYVTFSGSNVLSGYDGWINVDNAHTYQTAKPLFADPPAGDYSLAEGSQAINQGNNRYIFYDDGTEIVYDLSSGTRVVSRIVDLGAYEYQAESPNVPDAPKGLSVSSYGANRHRLDWLEVPGATSYVAEWSTDQLTWIEVFSNATSVVISGLDYGARVYYRVKAQADGHIDSDYSDKVAQIVCPMDIDGDGDISNGDRALLFSAWLTDDTDENWDPRCDINGDSDVTGADRALLSLNWLKEAGDDDLIYPAPLAESVLSDAAFDSVSLDDNFLKVDLDIF
jgi:hypothetical protein